MMEQRYHVLKYGTRLHEMSNSDKVQTTCCSLHDVFLFVDGLGKLNNDDTHNTDSLFLAKIHNDEREPNEKKTNTKLCRRKIS